MIRSVAWLWVCVILATVAVAQTVAQTSTPSPPSPCGQGYGDTYLATLKFRADAYEEQTARLTAELVAAKAERDAARKKLTEQENSKPQEPW